MASEWPSCLWAIAATAILVEEATLSQPLDGLTLYQAVNPRSKRTHLDDGEKVNQIPGHAHNPGVTLKTCDNVNPGPLLPTGPITDHSYEQVIAHTSVREPEF